MEIPDSLLQLFNTFHGNIGLALGRSSHFDELMSIRVGRLKLSLFDKLLTNDDDINVLRLLVLAYLEFNLFREGYTLPREPVRCLI